MCHIQNVPDYNAPQTCHICHMSHVSHVTCVTCCVTCATCVANIFTAVSWTSCWLKSCQRCGFQTSHNVPYNMISHVPCNTCHMMSNVPYKTCHKMWFCTKALHMRSQWWGVPSSRHPAAAKCISRIKLKLEKCISRIRFILANLKKCISRIKSNLQLQLNINFTDLS